MTYVRGIITDNSVSGVYNDIALAGIEKMRHVSLEYRVFNKVIYDVERKG